MRGWLGTTLALLLAGATHADEIYSYDSHDEETGEILARATRRVAPPADGRIRVTIDWTCLADSTSDRQVYVLDGDFATLQWETVSDGDGTDYAGVRDGDVLSFSGRHLGEPVDETYEIDSKPFHLNPTVGLQSFALSGERKVEFWSLRPSNLSKHKMKAENEGTETIEVGGTPVETVRVKWGLTGLKSVFFSQTLWFRAADGVFLRSSPSRGRWSELVGEETVPSAGDGAPDR